MPLAVLDLDITSLPAALEDVGRYDGALVLLRVDGRPAGQALIELSGERLEGTRLREALLREADSAFWQTWLESRLRVRRAAAAGRSPPSATVCVCTRDRPDDLRRCLEALLGLPEDGQELLVVDNAPSTGATLALVREFSERRRRLAGGEVRYVREDRPGLDAARNRALREARGDVVAFTDDDACPDPAWLRTLLRNFEDPPVLCATGLTMPLELETRSQVWFQRLGGFTRGFKRMELDAAVLDPLEGWRAGAGVNMAFRREVLEEVGLFDDALDVGTPTEGGGDSDMFRRVLKAGYRIVYDPEALVWHRHRRQWSGLRRQLRGYESAGFGVWTRALLFEHDLGALSHFGRWLLREGANVSRSLLRRRGSGPLDIAMARLWGALRGPGAYLWSRASRRRLAAGSAAAGSAGAGRGEAVPAAEAASRDEAAVGDEASGAGPGASVARRRPALSVVIPTHRRSASLARTLDALGRQRGAGGRFEVVVVADGGADPGTRRACAGGRPYRLRLLERPAGGPAAARNAGAAAAEAPLILFLDDDVEPLPSLVDAHLRAHRGGGSRVVAGPYPPRARPEPDLHRVHVRRWWLDRFDALARAGHRWRYTDVLTGNLSLPAAVLGRVGGFDETITAPGREDYELGARLVAAGVEFVYAPDAAAVHHDHESSSLARDFGRARHEGGADVQLGRRHPDLRPGLPLADFAAPANLPSRLVRAAAFRPSPAWERGARAGGRLLSALERAGLRGAWKRLYRSLRVFWYLRGVADELGGGPSALRRFAGRPAGPSAPSEAPEPMPPTPASDRPGALVRLRQRGRDDVALGRRDPELRPRLWLARYELPFGLRGRFLYTFVFRWPERSEALASALEPALRRLERVGLPGAARRLRRALATFWYFRGVADELGGPGALGTFVREVSDRLALRGDGELELELELDLAEGIEAAEACLDARRPASVGVRLGDRPVGVIPAEAGAEPLRGVHLRRALAGELAPRLAEAAILRGARSAVDEVEALQAHLRRARWWGEGDPAEIWMEQYYQWTRFEDAVPSLGAEDPVGGEGAVVGPRAPRGGSDARAGDGVAASPPTHERERT